MAPASPLAAIDTFFDEMPGAKAEFIAEALKMEGITCRLECEGLVQHRGPGQALAAPIAMTLPVSIYLGAADVEHAREIVASIESEDLIGESWSEAGVEEGAAEEDGPDPGPSAPAASAEEADADASDDVRPEGSNARLLVLLVAAVLVILFMLRR